MALGLTAVVPATDEPPTLAACLDAIRAADDPPDEVVVVRAPAGLGPAGARNDGARRASGAAIVFVDADVLVHADAFRRIRARLADDPGLVAVFGSYDDRVATRGVVSGFRNLLHHCVHQRSSGPAETFWAGLGAVRRDAFLAAGGFDAERFLRPSVEDIELGGRLARLGRIDLDPQLRGTHLKSWTLRSMIVTDLAHRGVPWVRLMLEHRALPRTLNLGARERASAVAAAAAAGALARRRPALTAGALAAQVVLNRDLYRLLLRRLGVAGAAAGVALHAVHQLAALAAVPVGVVAHAATRRSRRARRR